MSTAAILTGGRTARFGGRDKSALVSTSADDEEFGEPLGH